ncbi:putative GNAT family N-acyltransferase [Pullulanibacillus pueri]|uniref:N-acetyltransferase n=1 Tax=Pullulanibacillus pueri TaxID=1437324 RepID=A0A8J3ENB3_9BACL|nr:GNAT family N-acetyltransferase [Pullulanibacillus pueri]MBM7680614.1 putative GNAT family N-acyltransferase [Pullulanibacillus pueri]GGH83935.1 N-acetyltransferase [Pullulanibacillus pueri]
MDIIIVENEQQYQDALTVRKTVFVEEQQVPMELEVDEHEKSAVHFVIYHEKHPVGAGRIRIKGQTAKVERICVLKEARGQNIGLALMQRIEHVALEKGLKTLVLHAQTHAQGFYEKLGYKVTSDLFYDANIPHVEMTKAIQTTSVVK